jgi:hypothetical protein
MLQLTGPSLGANWHRYRYEQIEQVLAGRGVVLPGARRVADLEFRRRHVDLTCLHARKDSVGNCRHIDPGEHRPVEQP